MRCLSRLFGYRPWGVAVVLVWASWGGNPLPVQAEVYRPLPLSARIESVQPMTGIVLWTTNEHAASAPIQLEYAYFHYGQIVSSKGEYDWTSLERLLDEVAGRGHQAIIRWHDTYVGKPAGVPAYFREMPEFKITRGLSEKQQTEFPDWSHAGWREFVLEFFSQFAARYDNDPRLAFVQVGFGLWSEYHIYDGPMELGKTFPDKPYQAKFVRHLANTFEKTPWMISVDAGANWAPFAESPELLALPFGVFDDSFNHKRHRQENEPNWNTFGRERWKRAPAGGEFSFFEPADQRKALAPKGPHGIPFEEQAAKFHVSFIIGDDQPRLQKPERIREAGLACGYRFRVTRFEANSDSTRVEIENIGIAPLYHEAYPAVDGQSAQNSLKGLLPGERRLFVIETASAQPELKITSPRLVPGQKIEYEAQLTAP